MDLGLRGLKAIVAGSSKGLGYATADSLAAEGTDIAMNGRTAETLNAAARKISADHNANIYPILGDLVEAESPAKIVAQAVEALGGLDLLITNSGGPPTGKFESFDDDAWQHAADLVLMSHVRLIRAALPHLRQSKAGSVLTITSVSVKQPIPNLVLSNSLRSATVGLTKTLALELGADGIRFNSILPGWTVTERVHELMSARALINGTTIEDEIAKQAAESPFGRMASPTEFANVATFLLSPAASYLTGVMISVDGGMYKGVM
jgi:3-oxoacyl-[acyl-carrier protein] reductase